MKKRVCIAHYNENLNWVKNINQDVEVFIYHKNDNNNLLFDDKVNINQNNFELSNVGRESHTYLKHIIDNYHNLYDLEYFSQGYPDVCDFATVINTDEEYCYNQYSWKGVYFLSENAIMPSHMSNSNSLREIWFDLFDYEPPKEVKIIPHAFIKLDKETILMHDLNVYIKCLNYFNDNDKNNEYAWIFEYFWAFLFNDIHKKKLKNE